MQLYIIRYLIAQLFLYPLCNQRYIIHQKVTLLYLTNFSASKVKMNLFWICVACSGAMATSFNHLCYSNACRKQETQVPEVRSQIVNWMMNSNNAQNMEMAKQFLKMMNRSKPRRTKQQKQRLKRYLAHK